jgi:hypothetical protein
MTQQSLDFIEFTPSNKPQRLVAGGIYILKEEPVNGDYYDGKFGLCMGTDRFMFLVNGIYHIDMEVELACAHRMKLVEGYCLAINKKEKKWYIRNSGIKGQPGYILAEGEYLEGFEESLKPLFKVFMK